MPRVNAGEEELRAGVEEKKVGWDGRDDLDAYSAERARRMPSARVAGACLRTSAARWGCIFAMKTTSAMRSEMSSPAVSSALLKRLA